MDSLCEELQRSEPPSDLDRSIKKGRSELEKREDTQEVPPKTQKQTGETETTKPQSCRLCAQAKNLQIAPEEAERRMRYPEISLFDSKTYAQEKETYVFVWQTEDNRVAQTDIREPESKKHRKLTYLKHALKNFLQVARWIAVVFKMS